MSIRLTTQNKLAVNFLALDDNTRAKRIVATILSMRLKDLGTVNFFKTCSSLLVELSSGHSCPEIQTDGIRHSKYNYKNMIISFMNIAIISKK